MMAMVATFDIRRPTTVMRHSTTDSRQSNVGRRLAVGCRLSNVVLWKDPVTTQESVDTTQEDAVKDAVTTQEVAPKTDEVAPKDAEVAPKIAPKANGVAPKANDVAPKVDEAAPKIAPKADNVAPKDEESQKSAVKSLVADERVAEKCITLWSFLKEDPQRTITNAVERLSWSRRSIVSYIGILKQAKVLEHIGPYHGGAWKFLI